MKHYHSDLGVFEFQAEGVGECWVDPNPLVIYDTGLGKALRNDQRVATPKGWRTIDSLSVGDQVFGVDGQPCSVRGVFPQGVRDLWRVTFSDGQEVVCDTDHLWAVHTKAMKHQSRPDRVLTLKEIVDIGLTFPNGERRFFIPMADAVEFGEAHLPIDPYTLGVLLGDGGLTQGGPRLTTMDADMVEHLVLPEGTKTRVRIDPRSRAVTYRFVTERGQSNPLLDLLRSLGCCVKSHEKHIPEQYLKASVDQRWALLQGLLDTDGYCGESIQFGSTSRELAEGVRELVQSLGGTASIKGKQKSYRYLGELKAGLPSFNLTITLPSKLGCPFRITRKAAQWRPRRNPTRAMVSAERIESAEATCISVDGPHQLFLTEGYTVTHNTHISMILAALLFEDDLIDQVVVCAEVNKIKDWVSDFEKFTDLTVKLYYGDKLKRERIRNDLPQVIVGSYETIKNDAAVKGPTKKAAWTNGPLTTALVPRRTLVVYDECTRLRDRSKDIYKAHARMIRSLRAAFATTKVLGLTATPVESSPEQTYNMGRVIKGEGPMGTVAYWDENYVTRYDLFGKPCKFKNLGPDDHEDPEVPTLRARLSPIVKKKTDPDVIDQFPKQIEEFSVVPMGRVQKDFYNEVSGSLSPDTIAEWEDRYGKEKAELMTAQHDRKIFTTLRMIAGYPLAIASASGKLAGELTEAVGVEGLRAMGSAKRDRLLEDLRPIVDGQGAKVVLFTWFADTVLPLLAADLHSAGYKVVLNKGSMSPNQRQDSIERFRNGNAQIFLSSDAGSKGLNLPEALYIKNFELPVTHANYIQRINRNNRIDSKHPSVTCHSYITPDSVEEGLRSVAMRRNDWHDTLLADDDDGDAFITADDRRKLITNAYRLADLRAAE